jgi:hypothetical protein
MLFSISYHYKELKLNFNKLLFSMILAIQRQGPKYLRSNDMKKLKTENGKHVSSVGTAEVPNNTISNFFWTTDFTTHIANNDGRRQIG